ncbi:clarin-3-like [Clavelina lepadiformis]|uniref:clarin-3-like n=1 Tax=Clavelina lepadiformis TaxID=159417 RepID=UPI0040413A29
MRKGYAFCTFVAGLGAVALISASLGTETWAVLDIQRSNSSSNPCDVKRQLGLFNGIDDYQTGRQCLTTGTEEYNVYSDDEVTLRINSGILYAVIALSVVAILCGLFATAVAGYNLFDRPYETWAGPFGLLAYFTTGFIFDLVAVLMYVIYGSTDILENTLPKECESGICTDEGWEQTGGVFGYSLYLLIASMGVFILGIVLVFLSGKQIKKRLKQKFCPTSPEVEEEMEEKNKDVMIF